MKEDKLDLILGLEDLPHFLRSSLKRINKLKTRLNSLFQDFKLNPTEETKKKINVNTDLAMQLTRNLIVNLGQNYSDYDRGINISFRLNNFLESLFTMAAEVKLIEIECDKEKNFLNEFTSGFENNLMPDIGLIINLGSTTLKEELTSSKALTEDQINSIIDANSKLFTERLYGEETKSLLYKKYRGMSSHYLNLMQEVGKLFNENLELSNKNKTIDSLIQENKILIEENKTLSKKIETMEDKLSQLEENNSSLGKRITNLEYESLKSQEFKTKKPQGSSTFFKSNPKNESESEISFLLDKKSTKKPKKPKKKGL